MILSGTELSSIIKEDIKKTCLEFVNLYKRSPKLAVILVGNNPASQVYVRNKCKSCKEVGIEYSDIHFDENATQVDLITKINSLNTDQDIDGILVQLPLPSHIDEQAVIKTISPEKDVDGFHPYNLGKLFLGQETMIPCTPKGILRILDYYHIDTAGKNVCIIGRSNIVGKPIATLLAQKSRDATVTLCHTRTQNLIEHTRQADILIVATGHLNTLTADMVKDNAVVIDVGINRVPDPTKKSGIALKGDTDYNNLEPKAKITPVPGGVGPMTVTMLLENTLIVALRREGDQSGLVYKRFAFGA